ncbi:MAG: YicC/YloC family endoribonuclease [Methyloceanibacter sp.]
MTLKSMTGFARTDGTHEQIRWFWEVRSVNGRSLDVRLRLPSGLERLEPRVRARCQEQLVRGNCTISLALKRDAGQMEIRLNQAALGEAMAVAEQAQKQTLLEPAKLDTLLGMRGVVEVAEPDESEEQREAFAAALLAGLADALDQLVAARVAEGQRLEEVIEAQLAAIDTLVSQATAIMAQQPDLIAARLREQIARLDEAGASLDPERLHQEGLLLAAKADIQEELDRLTAHVAAARELIASGQPTGRKLEFLAQEFNREANTTCSKAAGIEISRIGLELKSVIDQLREQVQNIE